MSILVFIYKDDLNMVISVREFENTYRDKIAVVYELDKSVNRDGAIEVNKIPVKIDNSDKNYYLDPFKDYLIICGLSSYRANGKTISISFMSKRHPLYGIIE